MSTSAFASFSIDCGAGLACQTRSPRPSALAAPAESTRLEILGDAFTLRRWDAGETHRNNKAHWAKATGQNINADLAAYLKTLRARCAYEAANNPMVEGMLFTHQTDLIGNDGPRLQVLSESEEYNTAVEGIWKEWFANADVNRELAGPELLKNWIRMQWVKGEHLAQFVTDRERGLDEISLRVLNLDPDRLDTDLSSQGDANVALGVRRSRTGRPLAYQISEASWSGPFRLQNLTYQEYSADEVIHQFERLEPDQVRGVPWLASGLPTIADLRDFDVAVLNCARLAASMGVCWWTDHPDAPYIPVTDTAQFQPNTNFTGPPGYKPELVDPKQPSGNYVEFRTERYRELGRAKSIPLMKILLGSERHNFSSARMDNMNYQRGCEAIQSWLERGSLRPMLLAVLREAILLRRAGRFLLPPAPSGSIVMRWIWPKQPAVDPLKESNAETIQMQNGSLPYADLCANYGRDEDDVIASRARSAKKLEDAGLPALPEPQTKQSTLQPATADTKPKNTTTSTTKQKAAASG